MLRKTVLFLSILLLAGCAFASDWNPLNGTRSGEPVITASASASGSTIINVRLDGYNSENCVTVDGTAVRLLLPGGVNQTEAGYPDMQHLAIGIQIPESGQSKLSIISAEYTEINNILVVPSRGDPAYPEPAIADTYSFENQVYNNNEFYPNTIASADAPYIWCDTRGQAVQVYPFSYNPVAKTLRIYHTIVIEIAYTSEPGVNELTRFGADYGTLRGMRNMAGSHFANYASSSRNLLNEEPGNMLIITCGSFIETLRPFIEWKTRTGIACEVADVATLGNAAAIKQYVSDYYYNHGLTYLLIAGDAAQVPTLQAETGSSDNMYGYIAGNDHYPEILTGRFPAETAAQLETMINRSIGYEMNPSATAGYNRFLGIASELGPGDDGEADYEHIRKIGNTLLEKDYVTFTEMYDGNHDGTDGPGNPAATEVAKAVNQGQGAIMYIGHGTKNGWQTSGFSGSDALALQNTETHPFIWSAGCNNGDFETSTCFAETWLRAEYNGNPAGAVAVMMSTSTQSWYPPMEAQDEIALILSGKKPLVTARTFGGISMSACVKMNDKYGIGGYRVTDTWTIFGDPSILVRTAPAQDILTHHAPEYGADTRVFVVKLPDSNAMACITQQQKLLGGATAAEGFATISVAEPITSDSITITVTGFNLRPYSADVAVTFNPAIAIEPFPGNNSHKVSVYTSLEWNTGTGTLPGYYKVFLAEGNNPEWAGNGTEVTEQSFIPAQRLLYNTTYTWKVISYNQYGLAESRNFSFTTISPPDEDFESQGFPRNSWTNNSHNSWHTDGDVSFEGQYSLRSGSISDNDTSRLVYECYTPSCDFLGFRMKISSQENADKLQLFIDGAKVGDWSGEMAWSEESFAVEAGSHSIAWIYIKDNSGSAGSDAVWIDNIYLPVNEPALLQTVSESICSSGIIFPVATVSGQTRIQWGTSGTGYFSDESDPNSAYYPSQDELNTGLVSLSILAFSNALCNPQAGELTISLISLPELPVVRDTILYSGEKYPIAMPESNVSSFKVSPEGLVDYNYTIESSNLRPGANEFSITTENESGCTNEQTFVVTLIEGRRPSAGNGLNIYPNPASETITIAPAGIIQDNFSLQVFDLAGRIVAEQNNTAMQPQVINLGSVMEGVYLVRVQNGPEILSGRFVKLP